MGTGEQKYESKKDVAKRGTTKEIQRFQKRSNGPKLAYPRAAGSGGV